MAMCWEPRPFKLPESSGAEGWLLLRASGAAAWGWERVGQEWGEQAVVPRAIERGGIGLAGEPQLLMCVVDLAQSNRKPGRTEVKPHIRVTRTALVDSGACILVAPKVREPVGAESVLPGRRFEPFRLGADREDNRFRHGRVRNSVLAGCEDHERTRRGIELVFARAKPCPAGDNDIEFLVIVLVFLDDQVTGFGTPIRVDPEGIDAKRVPDRLPLQFPAQRGERLDLIEMDPPQGL